MAVTKILPRNGGLKEAIDYVLNGDKTDGHILTAHFNCDPGREYREMMKTKLETGRLDKRQCYHIIQSFKPGEITPELALEIAKAFAQEHLDGFEVVIGTHVDRHHIHSHIVFNSVNADTGEKYHSTQQSYYQQIRAISDRLCREHGLSVIVQGAPARSVSYIEWLRQSRGQPTFRSMLEQICMTPSGTPTTSATSSCSWSIRGMRSIMAAGSVSACVDRSDFSTPAGEIRCSQRTESVLPSRATWNRSKRDCGLSCLRGWRISRTGSIPDTAVSCPLCPLSLSAGQNRKAAVSAPHDAASAAGGHALRAVSGAVRVPAGK